MCVRLKKNYLFTIYSDEEIVQHKTSELVPSKKQEKLNKKAIKSVQNESDDDDEDGNF